uniref:DH domain-containing protein n=1 Tax=Myripristis murdjan TaxID=586833 RepID=A0A667XCL4_9TELE
MLAQSDCRGDEDGRCLSSNTITQMYSCFGNGLPVKSLKSQISAIKSSERAPSGTEPQETNIARRSVGFDDESDETANQDEVFSSPIDISSALRSVALMRTWDLGRTHFPVQKLFSVPGHGDKDNRLSSPIADKCENEEGAEDPVEAEALGVSFQSKYFNIFPLYQDYCLTVKADLHRVTKGFLSDLLTSQCLPGLQSPLTPRSLFEVTCPPSPPPVVIPSSTPPHFLGSSRCTFWQDLDEVKASGLLNKLTTREIRLQEATFELIGSEASYLRSLGVAVNHFYASKTLKQTLSQMEHHILFSNLRHVMAASERFLMDLEVRLGESVLIS